MDTKVKNFLNNYGEKITEQKKDLLKNIADIRTESATALSRIKSVADVNNPLDGVRKYSEPKLSNLDKLEEEITNHFGTELIGTIQNETLFINVFKSYSLFFAIYCFVLLYLNAYDEMLKNDLRFYYALMSFNIFSLLFCVFIFFFSLPKSLNWLYKELPDWVKKMPYIIILFKFILFFILSIVYYKLNNPFATADWRSPAINFSVLLLLFPLFAYMFRIIIAGWRINSQLRKENKDYSARITTTRGELHTDKLLDAQKDFDDLLNNNGAPGEPKKPN